MNTFNNKVVVITGGATGIGFSFAKRFGLEGAKVIISGRRENRLQEAVAELEKEAIQAAYYVCDVVKREDIEGLADFAWSRFGQVDVLMNNAGCMTVDKPVIGSTVQDFLDIYQANIFGVVNGCSVFGERFIKQGTPAALYNLGSENSFFNGVPTGAPYVSSKHAVLAITESLKEEVPEFIDVSLVCPGYVASELMPPEAAAIAMDTDQYTDLAMKQLKNNEFFVVSHAYNMQRINQRNQEIEKAYATYAPRYEGDIQYDVRTLLTHMAANAE